MCAQYVITNYYYVRSTLLRKKELEKADKLLDKITESFMEDSFHKPDKENKQCINKTNL